MDIGKPILESMPPEVGEIIAWRAWQIVRTDEGLRLKSVSQPNVWGLDGLMDGVVAPYSGSGIYASKTRNMIASSDYATFNVIGEVALWGDVVEHENGYRAQYAKVKSLELHYARGIAIRDVDGRNIEFPKDSAERRVINELRRTYGLPYEEEPLPKRRYGRTILKWAFRSVLVACWSALIYYDVIHVIQWLTQTPAQ